MHEAGFARELIDLTRQEVSRAGPAGKVLSIRIRLGGLAGVSAEALRFAFEVLTRGTDLESTELLTEQLPITGRCNACGSASPLDDPFGPCPRCGSLEMQLDASRGVQLHSIEIEAA